jgi:membrane-associated phospholipid phosphatase
MSGGDEVNPVWSALRWAGALALALAGLSALVGLGHARDADQWVLKQAQSIASYPLNVATTLFNILGQLEVTGPIAVVLAFVWWRRDGVRGLVPLLLFVGVALEIALKHAVPHASPSPALSRNLHLLPFLKSAAPYSFPSGHMLRTVFLAALVTERPVFWGLVAAMALSLLYLSERWASDVVGGALLGFVLAGVAAAIYGGRTASRGRRR